MKLRIVELAKLFSGKHNISIFAGNKIYIFRKPRASYASNTKNLWAFYPEPQDE